MCIEQNSESEWKLLIQTAKREHDNGHKERAIRLYRNALMFASRSKDSKELREYLCAVLWSSTSNQRIAPINAGAHGLPGFGHRM